MLPKLVRNNSGPNQNTTTGSNMKTIPFLAALAAAIALPFSATAQTSSGSMLYTPTGNLSSGPQNTFAGTVGGVFLTTYSYWPNVNWLGYYDKDGDGLANSHQVALWGGNNNLLASVTVPAGTAAPLVNGYRWSAWMNACPASRRAFMKAGRYPTMAKCGPSRGSLTPVPAITV